MKNISIRLRLLIICLGLVTVPTVAMGLLSYRVFRQNAHKSAENNLHLMAEGWKITTESYVEQTDRVLKRENALVHQRLGSIALNAKKMLEAFTEYHHDSTLQNKQAHREHIYNKISEIKIGRSGYVFILKPDGKYIVSKNNAINGKNVLDMVSTGNRNGFAKTLKNAKQAHNDSFYSIYDYEIDITGSKKWRKKTTAFTYFEPLDVIIGAGMYYTDFKSYELLELLQRELKSKIAAQRIGKNGYMFVINSNGDYIVSKDRLRDGENVIEEKDENGNYFVAEMIRDAKKTPNGATYHYHWRNVNEKKATKKTTVMVYVPQWDWIIGASAYHQDFLTGLVSIRLYLLLICSAAIIIGTIIAYLFAMFISKPIKELEHIALKATNGDLNVQVNKKLKNQTDEIGNLARSFYTMIKNLKERIYQLNKSEERFREVAENSVEWLWEIDTNGLYTYCSPIAEQIIGYKPEELIGKKHFFDLFAEEYKEKLKTAAIKAFAEKKKFNGFENCNIHKNGQLVWVVTNGVPMLDKNGNLLGYRGSDINITERKLAEQQKRQKLKRARRQEAAIFELSTNPALTSGNFELAIDNITEITTKALNIEKAGVWLFDEDRKKLQCVNLYDKNKQQHSKGSFLETEKYPRYFELLKQGLPIDAEDVLRDSRISEFAEDYFKPEKIKSSLDVAIRVSGEIIGVLCSESIADYHKWTPDEISFTGKIADQIEQAFLNNQRKKDRQMLEELNSELAATNTELKSFVYIASHDLREPLRKITAFGAILKKTVGQKIEGDDLENLDFMIEGASRMTQMVDGLLTYSRINTKVLPAETVDLNFIVNQLEELELSILLEEKNVTINIPKPLPNVEVDPVQIRQLIQNLIANGIKYQKPDSTPHIKITSKPASDNMVRIEITDNGIGIKPEYHQSVFSMFKRLHARNEYEGTGIGLAVCKKIVARHGGQLGIESEYGKGSTFWFTLPTAKSAVCAKA